MIQLLGNILIFSAFLLSIYADVTTKTFAILLVVGVVISTVGQASRKKKRKKPAKKKTSHQKKKATNHKDSIHRSNRLGSDTEILASAIDDLSWREFERLAYLYYKSKGATPELTKSGADGGIDLIYFSKEENSKVAVQIKHFSKNQITPAIIRETENAARKNYKIYISEIFTSTRLTPQSTCTVSLSTILHLELKLLLFQNSKFVLGHRSLI